MSSIEQLTKAVLEKSVSKNWDTAVKEWDLMDTSEDVTVSSICVCGKPGIRYLHRITNLFNDQTIYPVGSCCIKKFNRADLNEKIEVKEKLFELYQAVGSNKFLSLSTELFSRKLIMYLFKEGAFESNNPNYSALNNYTFFLKMFNKRDKESITPAQDKKIKAILLNNIRPFIRKQLAGKFVSKKI